MHSHEDETSASRLRGEASRHLWMHNRGWNEFVDDEPVIAASGTGIRITDIEGREWVDVNGGYMSVHIGYGRDEVARAAFEQMLSIPYFPYGTTTQPTIELAAKLAEITPGDLSRSFLVSGGSEANETSLKVARAYYRRAGHAGRYKVISRRDSYHGALGQTMWLGGSSSGAARTDYEPGPPGMLYAPQPNPYRCELGGESPSECAELCANAIEEMIVFNGPDTVAAVIAEPVALPPSVAVPGDEYWPRLRKICDRYGVILIADEVITGFGRTGKMFAVEHWDVVPDVMSVAKGIISSYLPLGASIVREDIANAFAGGPDTGFLQHILTFAGHPVAAAAALKNIEIIEDEALVDNAAIQGLYFRERLEELKERHEIIGNVAGLGLLLGIDLVKDRETTEQFRASDGVGDMLMTEFKKRSLILRPAPSGVSFGPPLSITKDDIDEIISGVDEALAVVSRKLGK